MFINDICIAFFSNCNWRCKYCIASYNHIPLDEAKVFKEIIPVLPKLETLWISGGEPGIASESFWDNIFNSINFKLKICTNGTFIKRGYYDKYRDQISRLMIHCVTELDHDIDDQVLSIIREDDHTNIETNVVIHKYNGHLIKDFLMKYPDIKFELNFTDKTFAEFKKGSYDYNIDRKSAEFILSEFSKVKGYSKKTHPLLLALLKNNFECINSWSSKNINKIT